MNVAMLLDMVADGFGDRMAVGDRDGGLTFSALRAAAGGVAARLAGSGAERLAVAEPNGPIVPATLFGAAWAGVSYAPINYRLPGASQRELLDRLEPAMLATPDWLRPDGAPGRSFPDEPGSPAVLLFTSGTASAPKAAVLRHDNLLAYVLNTIEFGCADEREANLLSVPPFHIAGVVGVLTSTYAGRRIVPLPSFSAEEWLATARREQVTHAFLVPTMLARIVAVMDADPEARVPSLRALSYGGARMPTPVLERALELFPDTGFVNAYGMTETSSTVSVLGPDDHRVAAASADPSIHRRLESAGRPVPGIEVRIDREGEATGAGDVGEILVRGAQVSGEYVEKESRRDPAGWMHTGDLGYLDGDGYLFVVGRSDDMIIRGGENVSPTEVEDRLLRHPAVAAAACVGLPDPEWGERVAAMVVLRPGATASPEELRSWAREALGSLKGPETIAVRDELPATPTGKVLRREIRAELSAESGQRASS